MFSTNDAVAAYISAYARGMLSGGLLHSTSERLEGFIAYKMPGQKLGLKTVMPIAKGVFSSLNLKEIARFVSLASKGGPDLKSRLDKEKQPYEKYQGQGYMRRLMEMVYAEGNRLGVPVVLDTDARSKCDKYEHLGMQLAGTRDFGQYGTLYDLIKYPDAK